jgi:hypothetical protein
MITFIKNLFQKLMAIISRAKKYRMKPRVIRYDGIFIPNTSQVLYYGPSTNFRTTHSIPGTDLVEVEVPAGTYDYFEAHIIENVRFVVTGGQAILNSFSCKVGSKDIYINGTSESGVTYGLKTIGSGSFAGLFQTVGNLWISGWNADGNAMGIQVSHNPTETYALDYCRLIIENCRMENTGSEGEGFYIGHDSLSTEVLIDMRIRYNQVEDTGRDGIQMRNASTIVCHNNSIINVGLGAITAHMHGILVGANTNGAYIYDNTGSFIAGNGIFANGFGELVFENNTLVTTGASDLYGIYTKNYESDTADLQSVGFQKFYFIDNDINPTNNTYALVMARDALKCPVSVYKSGNDFHSKSEFIETGNGIVISGTDDHTPFVETWAPAYPWI